MKKSILIALTLWAIFSLTGCGDGKTGEGQDGQSRESADADTVTSSADAKETNVVLTEEIIELEKGFSAVRYDKDYGFDKFLSEGGASSDKEVVSFLTENLLSGMDIDFNGNFFGCSTIAVQTLDGEALFGRNFDWNRCEAMVVLSYPENGYASISTVNLDFIGQEGPVDMALKQDEIKTLAALYAPLDGMNEKGLAVSVNMIQDSASIEQDTEKPDITTTTAIRLLLDKSATVDEALELLKRYDMHASMGMMVHFALADATGKSVAVEYIENEMVVTETPILTNFYLAEGEKNGIGTAQSHTRYDILAERLKESKAMSVEDVRDALSSVSKGNFGEFESTEWSIVFNQTKGQAVYYHRENYEQGYAFAFE
ncbi:MAG: linear amide C-N hydrolase [Bacteroidales bacterium]|nr:linear amide C-N hydrolase [Lachnoclostridium sp.]MCM1384401.1 linear amide C-N hydrolase [Lachnoclostridium sp.]MCM1465181.1 linear amide C-N hydrolase [Bacteroidales bacterium]